MDIAPQASNGYLAKERTCAPTETTRARRFQFRVGALAWLELFRRFKIICLQIHTLNAS